MKFGFVGCSSVAAMAMTLCLSAPATAQEAPVADAPKAAEESPTDPSDIVVTARKVGERLQDIPLSINAFSGEMLERRDITNTDALTKASPGISLFAGQDRSYGVLTFRGMRNNSTADPTRENSSVFIDGVYYIGNVNVLNFDDLERVEIVKGPQSAFFGRSTFGGAINFITKTPANEFGGNLFVRAATYSQYEVRGAIEGPLVKDVLGVRLNGRYESFGGMYRNASTGGRLGEQETLALAGSFNFTPSESLSIRGRVAYDEQTDGSPAAQLVGRKPTHNCTIGGATRYCGLIRFTGVPAIAPVTPLARAKVPPMGLRRNFTDASLNATYEFAEGWSMTSLSAYQKERLTNVDNYTHAGEDIYDFYRYRTQDAKSTEFRIASPQSSRLRGLIGLYYIDQNYATNESYIIGTQNNFAAAFGGVGTVTAGSPLTKRIKNKAVFGSLAFDITPQFTVSAEARYQNDNVVNTAGTARTEFSTDAFLPRVIVDYKLTPNIMIYGSIADGNKPTQANAAVVALSAERQAIAARQGLSLVAQEEKVRNYELGIKTRFLDDRVTLNVNAFLADWKNKQTSNSVNIDFNGDGRIDPTLTGANREYFVGVILPQGDERVTGIEVETVIRATRELTLSGSFAYTDPKFLSPTIINDFYAGTLDASGQRDPNISQYTASGSIDYERPISESVTGFARADLNYQSSRFASVLNEAYTGDAYYLNLKAGFLTGPFTVTFYVDNVLNDKTVTSIRSQGDAGYDQLAFRVTAYEIALPRKRQFGVTVGAKF